MNNEPDEPNSGPKSTRTKTVLRLVALAGFAVATGLAVKSTGMGPAELLEWVRATILALGPAGVLLFVVVFAAGELAHVPGLVFVAAAVLAYGPIGGALVGYLGAVVSVMVSFWVVRKVGGQPLGEIQQPLFRKIMGRLESQPIRVVIVLRLLMFMAPALNYALAMTHVKTKDYLLGSAIGLVLPIGGSVVFMDWLLANFL